MTRQQITVAVLAVVALLGTLQGWQWWRQEGREWWRVRRMIKESKKRR